MSETTTPTKPARTYPAKRQKVPAFARFEGTSAYKISRIRTRAYESFKETRRAAEAATTAA